MDQLAAAGFDLVHTFDAQRVARELAQPWLADPDRPRGVLVGNTRALWPRFIAALRADPVLAESTDPLDLYTERTLDAAGERVFYAHRRYEGAFLPFQRVAVAAGLGALSSTQLVIHPIYGPWFALRAVMLVTGDAVSHPLLTSPCRCDSTCHAAFSRAMSSDSWRAWLDVRDACTVGRSYRYDEDQLVYHYTKDRSRLR